MDFALKQFFDLFFKPEIKRRFEQGNLRHDFEIMIAQAIMDSDGKTVVRFNDEARFRGLMRAQRNIRAGERLLRHDFATLTEIELAPEEMNFGHVTLVSSGLNWFCSFNFLKDRNKAASFIDQAETFLETAAHAIGKSFTQVAIENLHTAAEKIALAYLMVHSQKGGSGKSHGGIRSGINAWGRLGNVDPKFVSLFNKITSLRDQYRYAVDVPNGIVPIDAHDILRDEISRVRRYWRWRDGDPILDNRLPPDIVRVTAEYISAVPPPRIT